MTFNPTLVRLLSNVPFFNDYNHTMSFKDSTAQRLYFESKVTHSYTDFTYQRQENYIMFHNPDNLYKKWFYGFITKKEYINPHTTRIFFEIDVYQTWQFEMKWKPSYIVREHRDRWNTDGSPVINTVDEGLDYGTDYQVVSAEQYQPTAGIYYLVICSKQGMHGDVDQAYYAMQNGVPQLLCYYVHPFKLNGDTPSTNLGTLSDVVDVLASMYTSNNAVNNIVSIYITDFLPDMPGNNNGVVSFSTHYEKVTLAGQLNGADVVTIFVKDMVYGGFSYAAGEKYEGYAPQTESKLLMHPYTVLELQDLRGNKVTYKNEYIDGDLINLTIMGSLGFSNKVAYNVQGYLTGPAMNDDFIKNKVTVEHSLISNEPNDLPILTDYLSAYIQGNRNTLQNTKNQTLFNGAMGLAQAGVGAAMGGPIGPMMAMQGIQDVANTAFAIQGMNAKKSDIANAPPGITKMGGNTYFDFGNGLTGIWIIKKQITPEYQKRLTDYFKMYGYRINELKIPNLKTRESFNYVQTVAANISGNIPNDEMFKLKSIFNAGITIWHGDYVGDYSRSNDEI
jgi:hypothetical protein